MAGVLELVDVCPDLGFPGPVVNRSLATGGAAGMEFTDYRMGSELRLKFDEDAADFLDIFIFSNHVFVSKDIAKAEFAGFPLGFRASVERAILGPQLLGRVAGHPKGLFVEHSVSPQELLCAPKVLPTAPNRETRIPVTTVPSNLNALLQDLTVSFP